MLSAVHVLEREALPSLYRAVIPLPKLGFRGGLPQLAGLFPTHVVALPPPSRWGSFSLSLSSFFSSHRTTINTKPPHQTFKIFSSRSILHPSPHPQTHRRHLSTPDPVPKILRASTPSPSNHAPGSLFLLGVHSTAGNLIPPPRTTVLPTPERPPPKPPPLKRLRVLVRPSNPTYSVVLFVRSPALRLAPIRPPPKPPWLLCGSLDLLVWAFNFGVSMGSGFQFGGTGLFWLKYAQQVFDENPQRALGCLSTCLWVLLQYMVIVKTFGDDTFAYDHTSFQLVLMSHDKWVNLETIFSRIERTQVKDIIRNWIERKTAESLSLITTSTWELKLLLLWLFRCWDWVAYVLMDLKHSKCIGLNAHSSCVVVSYVVVAPSLWFGNVQPHLLHVILLMLLVSVN